jgi:hypothetical protein
MSKTSFRTARLAFQNWRHVLAECLATIVAPAVIVSDLTAVRARACGLSTWTEEAVSRSESRTTEKPLLDKNPVIHVYYM